MRAPHPQVPEEGLLDTPVVPVQRHYADAHLGRQPGPNLHEKHGPKVCRYDEGPAAEWPRPKCDADAHGELEYIRDYKGLG